MTAPRGSAALDASVGPSRGRKAAGLALGTAVFVVLLVLPPPEGLALAPWRVAAVAALLAIFWLTEALPLSATALLPIVLVPTLGVMPVAAAAAPYADPIVFLFLGGFLIALAIERWNLHRRMALNVLARVGSREDLQIAGFMIATAALSMWVSNTATTALMLPVALSVVPRPVAGASDAASRGFATALMLSIAYAASAGGIATLIGTPPNAFLAAFLRETYGIEIGFAQWMLLGVPLSLVMLVATWFLLTRVLFPVGRREVEGARSTIARELAALGQASVAEKRVAIVFCATALAWILRPLLARQFPALQLSDTTIALAGALVLFLIPSGTGKSERLLTWEYAERLPWGVLLLFGGGLSLAAAVAGTGLAEWIGAALGGFAAWPIWLLVVLVTVLIIFLTELTSNIATTATFLPVVAALSVGLGEGPLLLAVPAALAASFAFMLPVATPPNAIVFASGHVTVPQMVRAGLWLNAVGTVAVIAAVYFIAGAVFG
jgi:sodium-dependent dicarboxylate transporter 2/3/5